MKRIPLVRKNALLLVAAFVVIGFFVPLPATQLVTNCQSTPGVSAQCVYVAQTNLMSVFLMIVVLLLWRFTRIQVPADIDRPVAAYQRFFAFFIDMFVVMACVVTMSVLVALSFESVKTGSWSWQVIRKDAGPTNFAISFGGVLINFWVLIKMLSQCASAGRPTFGQLVAGYRVTRGNEGVRPQYVTRVFYSFIGMCMWPVLLYKSWSNGGGEFWWDTATNTKVIRSESISSLP